MAEISESACCKFELEIPIAAPRERVWKAIFDETNEWWLPDFHVAGPDSVVTFDPKVGGRGLIEESKAGDALLWYSVQMYLPGQFKVYLVGHIAPEWGGPTTSMLKIALTESESGCMFQLSDARHGAVEDQKVQSYESGWRQLFTDGLKAYVEQNV